MSGKVSLTVADDVARVTLSHPGKFNAMSRTMWRELRQVFESLQANERLRCVVLSGDDGHFCAGGDISEYASFRFAENSLRDFHENDVWGGLQAILNCDCPVIAAIQGNCLGGGLEMASCCDLRVATRSARFGAPIARLGFPMAPREAALVLHAVGELSAREMLLFASVLEAAEMQRRGFLNQVTEDADLAPAVTAHVSRLENLSPRAARLNKQALRLLMPPQSAANALALIPQAYDYANSAEHREGIAAFAEKRPPQFAKSAPAPVRA